MKIQYILNVPDEELYFDLNQPIHEQFKIFAEFGYQKAIENATEINDNRKKEILHKYPDISSALNDMDGWANYKGNKHSKGFVIDMAINKGLLFAVGRLYKAMIEKYKGYDPEGYLQTEYTYSGFSQDEDDGAVAFEGIITLVYNPPMNCQQLRIKIYNENYLDDLPDFCKSFVEDMAKYLSQ